jgi:drug/metabolite transporter (DMT)-like permease
MTYLLLCTLMTVGLFMSFRSFSTFKIDTFQAIVFNYLVCVITGLIFVGDLEALSEINYKASWFPFGILLGGMFIGGFYCMGLTAQKVGVSVSTISSKMSLVIPVLFSMLVLQTESKPFNFFNYAGIGLALAAILLASVKKEKGAKQEAATPIQLMSFALPLGSFLISGMLDSTLNYVNLRHIHSETLQAVFPVVIFGVAALIGLSVMLIQRRKFAWKNVIGGIYLGIPNYFSIYFLIKALAEFNNDGAILYPSLNIGTIIASSLLAVVLFREKLLRINKFGIGLAVLALFLISHQEILNFFEK